MYGYCREKLHVNHFYEFKGSRKGAHSLTTPTTIKRPPTNAAAKKGVAPVICRVNKRENK